MAPSHSICSLGLAALALAAAAPAAAAGQTPARGAEAAASHFTIFLQGSPAGTEQIALTRTADGWLVTSSGGIGPPVDVVMRKVEVQYDGDWKPRELTVDAVVRGRTESLHTTVSGTTATTEVGTGGQPARKVETIAADALLLPSPFFGPYEALAARVHTAAPGATFQAYSVPQAVFPIRVGASSTEQIQTPARLIHARRTEVTFEPPGLPPLDAEIWGDETGRLLRVVVPAQGLDVVREDVASIASRRVTISRPNDEPARIPSNGFTLAGTVSRPAAPAAGRLPAVVLVGGSGPTDRDETVFGVPILGEVAGALADAGFVVLRYDKRGVGQSGGRAESATLGDYADDLHAAVDYMRDRKDVDDHRLAVLGRSEGGSVAMLEAAHDKHVDALVLVATMGVTGAELNMQQVRHALDRSGKSAAEQASTIELQKRIQQAALSGKGWDGLPAALRARADTPWFQSFLAFDPAGVMRDIRQPVLIVQGLLDTQVVPSNADALAAAARARKKAVADVVMVPGVNHLLLPATTGEPDEYGSLKDKHVSPEVTGAIVTWLRATFGMKPR